jgi:hypothetical protein
MQHTTIAYDPVSPEMTVNPFPTYARLRREAPVFFAERDGHWVQLFFQITPKSTAPERLAL